MRRLMGALSIFAVLFCVFLSTNASALEPIPDTGVIMSIEETLQKEAEVGSFVTYSWTLLNSNNVTYLVTLTLIPDNPNMVANLSTEQFQLPPYETEDVVLRVDSGTARTGEVGNVSVTFNATAQTTNESGELVVSTETEIVAATPVSDIPTVLLAFMAIGAIIFVGFFATLIFERTRVPDLLILVILGLILGPIAIAYFGVELVPRALLETVMPYFAALALVIILFDGGLNLNFDLVLRKINIAFIHTLVGFILTVISVAFVANVILGYPLIIGILLGAVLGGVSGAVIITLVRRMTMDEETQTVLTLEAVLTDVLCIIVALALVEFIIGTDDPAEAVTNLFAGFSIAFLVALFFGIFWLRILKRLYGKPFSFMITIAALFILYGFVELVGGSGAMAALIFGLVLGNKDEIARMFKIKTKFVLDERIKQFHSELSFVVRTFFFVFLGLVFTLSLSGHMDVETIIPGLDALNNTGTLFLIGVVLIFLALMAVRYLTTSITVRIHPESRDDKFAIWLMMGRGLAAAVLASLPFTINAFKEGTSYYDMMSPYKDQFLNIAFLIIVISVVVTTLGVVFSERRNAKQGPLELEKLRHERTQDSLKKKELKKKLDQERRMRVQAKKLQKKMDNKKKEK
ncbi:MAG: cation:proton antiporter [Thermoplasmata archaeon]|nr:cation:proton antiporter [Thermoplasmata archaeon]